MLEAFQSVRDEFSSFQKTSKQPEVEVDQTSASACKPGPSNQAVTLDPPPPRPWPTSHSVEAMEVDYGPSLRPRLGADQSQHDNTSDQHSGLSDKPTRVASARSKKHSYIKSMTLNQGPPQISIQVYPMSLGLHHLDLKNMQIEANTK